MASRRSRNWRQDFLGLPDLWRAVLTLGGLYLVVDYINIIANIIGIIVSILVLISIIFVYVRRRRREMCFQSLALEAGNYERTLLASFRQSRREDMFGNVDTTEWHRQIDLFLKSRIAPNDADFETWRRRKLGRDAAAWVDRFIYSKISERPLNSVTHYVAPEHLSPVQYEEHCADLLQKLGWISKMTPATGDHGADIIAERGGHRLVVQCKRYSQPVGNKAVQEAYSALGLYHGTIACVVAPAGFTRQAQRAAHGLKVHLLHHSDLEGLVRQLETKDGSQQVDG